MQILLLSAAFAVMVGCWGQPIATVYLTLGSTTITTNNTEVVMTIFGDGYFLPTLTCRTDLEACCRGIDTGTGGVGDWYYPDGRAVTSALDATEDEGFIRYRNSPQEVRLGRRNNTLTPTGSFCCVIPTTEGEMTICADLVVCPSFPPLANGSISYSDQTLGVGAVASFSCDPGYTLIGDIRTCTPHGIWSGLSSTCTVICIDLVTPHMGELSYDGGSINFRPVDTLASYTCNIGYKLNGESNRSCQIDTTWSGSPPTCSIVNCGLPPTIENGLRTFDVTTFGRTAAYSCNTGYIQSGSVSVTCLASGSWSPVPSCQIPPPVYLSLASNNFLSGVAVILVTSVGEDRNNSLICHTNFPVSSQGGGGLGEWYHPNGLVVREEGDLYVSRDNQSVILSYRNNGARTPSGLYCCVVPTSEGVGVDCIYLISLFKDEGLVVTTDLTGVTPVVQNNQADSTGLVLGSVMGVVVLVIIAATILLTIYLVFRHKFRIANKNQNVRVIYQPSATETQAATYEEIPVTLTDYTKNEAYIVTAAAVNRTTVSDVGGMERVYEN